MSIFLSTECCIGNGRKCHQCGDLPSPIDCLVCANLYANVWRRLRRVYRTERRSVEVRYLLASVFGLDYGKNGRKRERDVLNALSFVDLHQ